MDTAASRLKRKVREGGVAFKLGKRKAKLPEKLGKRFILAYEVVGGQCNTNDVVAVMSQVADQLEAAVGRVEDQGDGDEQEAEAGEAGGE